MRIVVWLVVLAGLYAGPAFAQFSPQLPSTDTANGAAATAMPVPVPQATEVLGAEGVGTSGSPAAVPLDQPLDPDTYSCGPGDLFELNFWGQQNFRLRLAADLEGRLFISKVGFVSVKGKKLSAVRAEVIRKVKGTYPGLRFELALIAPRTFVVHVAGSVARPGSYVATPLERVATLLARVGALTGSRREIEVKHRGGGSTIADLLMYELTGDTKYNPNLLDGDVVHVPLPKTVVAISGAVRRPGTYELVGSKDLVELLNLAGGLSSMVTHELPVRLLRRNAAQRESFVDLPFHASEVPNNTPLADGDRILVPTTDELQGYVRLIGAVVGAEAVDAATGSKRLVYVQGDTVMSVIDRAGGITAPGDLERSYVSRPRVGEAPKVIPVDLERLLVRRDRTADVEIALGDTIVVPPFRYGVTVDGAVTRAGLYNFNPAFTINEYIMRAGGRTRIARPLSDVRVVDVNGQTHSYSPNFRLSPGDAILVPERNFSRSEIAQLVLAGAGLVLSGVAITLAATR